MNGLAVTNTLDSRAAQRLTSVEDALSHAYSITKISRVALGEAPISLGTSVIGSALKLFANEDEPKVGAAIAEAGLVADGLLRGLFYKGGLLHARAANVAPWLVTSRAAPAGLGAVAGVLKTAATIGRTGLLGIGGVLGAMRAAHAVSRDGWSGLYSSWDGRSGALQAVGSMLLVIPHPVAQLGGAAVFAAELVNDLMQPASSAQPGGNPLV